MTIIATGIAFVFALITVISVLAHEKDIANEAKALHLDKLKKKKDS